jgi:polar amino acid transport system permease protein
VSAETVTQTKSSPPLAGLRPKRRLRAGRIVTVVVLIWVVASLAQGVFGNDLLHWDVVWQYLFDEQILRGLRMTMLLTVLSMGVATVIGIALALMALSNDPILRFISRIYITVGRSVPAMVQLLFWYFLAAVAPTLSFGIPFGQDLITFDTNQLISRFAAAMLGLSLGEAAFLAEYIRGGILSVPRGQQEAAAACGLTPRKTFARIVFPQAVRVILPAYGNSMISQVKNTSMVFVIGAGDLMTEAQLIYSQNFMQVPLLIVVSLWYLLVVVVMTHFQRRLETRYSRGYTRRVDKPARLSTWRPAWSRH